VLGHPEIGCTFDRQHQRLLSMTQILARQVVDQSERILDVASGKIRLILDDFATVLHQPELGFFDIVHSDFKDRTQRQSKLDK